MNNSHHISQEEFEQIEAYLNGQLSNEDMHIFEKKIENKEFKAKFEDIKTVLIGIETQTLKEQLNEFHKEFSSEQKPITQQVKVKTLHWKKIAIAAILVIGLGSFWIFNGNSNSRLYSEYFTPDPGLPTTMSSNANYEFYEAMVDYKQGNYNKATKKWKIMLATKPKSDTLNYFIGSALIADKKVNEAINFFKTVTELNNSSFKNEANYYLGLAQLKLNDPKAAIKSLKKANISNSKDLLKKLD